MLAEIWLAAGIVLACGTSILKGRLLGLTFAALWGCVAAFLFMKPVYSFRVSDPRDLIALGLYGTVGLIIARTSEPHGRVVRKDADESVRAERPEMVDLYSVWMDPGSHFAERFVEREIAVELSSLKDFRCCRTDAVRILSAAVSATLEDPQLRRVSLSFARKSGVQLLFVDALRTWPLPLNETIAIGRHEAQCTEAKFDGWPAHLAATWFENGYGRTYQIALRS